MARSIQIKNDADIIQATIKDITSGAKAPTLPYHNNPPAGLNAANQYAYALLDQSLFTMNAWEIGFVANMIKVNALSPKQRNRLKIIVKAHLNIDVDYQDELDVSAYAVNDNKKPKTRKKAA